MSKNNKYTYKYSLEKLLEFKTQNVIDTRISKYDNQ